MNVTELAHWRYRVKALQADLSQAQAPVTDYRYMEMLYGSDQAAEYWHEQRVEAERGIEMIRWLLEEAKFMVELGELALG